MRGSSASEVETLGSLTSKIEDEISDAVCKMLYAQAKGVPEGQVIVALSRVTGKATECLVRGSEAGKKNKVFSFVSDKESADFAINPGRHGSQDLLVLRHEADQDATRRCKDEIGLLWVNAFNEYQDLKRILRCWQCHLSPDARVVVNSCDQQGPKRVITEYLGDLGDFQYEQTVDNTIVFTIDQCAHHWMIDAEQMGVCKYCGRKRNFKRLMREATEAETRRVKGNIKKTKITQNMKGNFKNKK